MPADQPKPVRAEVFLLSERDGRLRFRRVGAPLPAGAHPDDAARQLSGLTASTPGAVLHSTSWRFEDGSVVLTYVALPDPQPHMGTRPVIVDTAAYGGPLTPSPVRIDADAVAAHACRHLALLAVSDEAIAAAARFQPVLWELLAKLEPITAGAVHPIHL